MAAHDDTISPYLLRPLRSYQEAMRDRAARIPCQADRFGGGSHGPARPETDDVERPR
jgi:hypothetical protein